MFFWKSAGIWCTLAVVIVLLTVIDGNGALINATLPIQEYNALFLLYNATKGPDWLWNTATGTEWTFPSDSNEPCTNAWEGVVCLNVTDNITAEIEWHVESLQLNSFNLVGSIPNSITNLTHISVLSLNGNHLHGSIPANVTETLLSLTNLDLGMNRLTGVIPPISNASRMVYYSLYENLLTSSLPLSIANVHSLLGFSFYSNLLTGEIPTGFQQRNLSMQFIVVNNNLLSGWLGCTPLEGSNFSMQINTLDLSSNMLTEPLPPTIGLLKMDQFYIDYNQIDGSLPQSLANTTYISCVYINNNQLTGSIVSMPTSIYYASVNFMTGTIPHAVYSYSALTDVFIGNNLFSGTLSPQYVSANMSVLGLSYNLLSGHIPPAYGSMTRCVWLYLNNNQLTGRIPSSLGTMTEMITLFLFSNRLTGSIPTELSRLESLQSLLLFENRLTGSMDSLFNASHQLNLFDVDVSSNQLTGTLSTELFQIKTLLSFVASSNCLRGSLSPLLCNARNLTSLILDGIVTASSCRHQYFAHSSLVSSYGLEHSVEGGIPSCLFDMPALQTLHLSGNGLTGEIPSSSSTKNSLADLSLSHNALTGSIPLWVQHAQWQQLDLSYNTFSGTLSSQLILPSETLALEVNRLSGDIPRQLYQTSAACNSSIDILNGNLFYCDTTRETLPRQDPDYRNYECGSNSFNASLYSWLALCGLIGAGLALVVFTRSAGCAYEADINKALVCI